MDFIDELNKPGCRRLPKVFNNKYGCVFCEELTECENVYTETGHIACKYACILDNYESYADYDRAAKKDFAKALSRFPEFVEDI